VGVSLFMGVSLDKLNRAAHGYPISCGTRQRIIDSLDDAKRHFDAIDESEMRA
jgi:hypothetical protein